MRTRKPDIRQSLQTRVLGIGVVLLFILCLFISLWAIIIVTRFVLG